jgi:hypothetical protein
MFAIFQKELRQFFSSLIGYIAIGVFLLLIGFLVWFAPDANILDSGYATLDYFFYIAPFILMMLIPAITMRSFSEEMQSGTIELLATRPLTDTDIIFGKFFAALALVHISPRLSYRQCRHRRYTRFLFRIDLPERCVCVDQPLHLFYYQESDSGIYWSGIYLLYYILCYRGLVEARRFLWQIRLPDRTDRSVRSL